MIELSDKQIAQFLHRSYTAVDGLWFMKVEEKYGFDSALDVDNEVWKVLAKIQARKMRELGKTGEGMEALYQCFTAKLALEGFQFEVERAPDGSSFQVIIQRCPWLDLLVKSGRERLADKVGSCICNTEYSAWAEEFGDDIRFELQSQICRGAESCRLNFSY